MSEPNYLLDDVVFELRETLCMHHHADEVDRLRAELDALRKQKPVLCVPASIATDCAHIAARGQFDAALDVARRYAQPFYPAPVPPATVAVPDELVRDAERYRWLREQHEKHLGLTIAKVNMYDLEPWSGDDPDAVIDAAMLAATPAPCATCDELRDNLSDALGGRLHTDDEKARMIDGLLEMIGRISDALGISKEDQSVASGDEEILFAIEELKAATHAPVAQKVCEWWQDDDVFMPGTWDGACGAKWTFTEGGPVDNEMRFCPECGGHVVLAAAQAQGPK